jgi:2-polyprenyl-6-methoxyphenol hydroxylase-like FAD-dependent oxidoreductase
MGTTLALTGAYDLAGAILQHPQDLDAAFAQYEKAMRPLVARGQKLAPGMPRLVNPHTSLGVWLLLWFSYLFCSLRLHLVLFALGRFGPPADAVPVSDYGLRKLDDSGP